MKFSHSVIIFPIKTRISQIFHEYWLVMLKIFSAVGLRKIQYLGLELTDFVEIFYEHLKMMCLNS